MSTPCTPCQTASPNLLKLDPLKRVNYTFGLVMGVEEFLQSDTYFLAKHHLENRLLHGYGTVCGLDVIAQITPQLEVQVTPGWAISPRGQEIRVSQLMCLQVNDWVQTNKAALQALLPGPAPSSLNLCVVLCYRECKTDVVPIPGEPCRTQSSSMAPSRIADSFELMLCLDQDASPPLASPPGSASDSGGLCMFRPLQLEDDSIRALATLLSEVQISSTGPFLTLEQMKDLVRDLYQPTGSPPAGPPYLVSAQDARDFRGAALRTWITEVRPFICAPQGAGPCCPPPEKCVLLAELVVNLNLGWNATGISVDDSRRPFLVPTRLLQETFFAEASTTSGSPYQTVAAGYFDMLGTPTGPTYNLTASPASPPTLGEFLLGFSGYQSPATMPGLNYIVKGTVQDTKTASVLRATFEFVGFESGGIRVRIMDTNSKALSTVLGYGFMVEISQIGGWS
jgi:hypothetical protein